jgi:WD40 repeat protein
MSCLDHGANALALILLAATLLLGAARTDEPVETKHPNGQVHERYTLDAAGKKSGTYEEFRADGTLALRCIYKGDVRQGHAEEFSADGKTIATGGADGMVRLWSPTGTPIKTFADLRPYRIEIVSVTFTPDNRQLLCSGMGQGIAFVLDLQTGRQQDPATPHSGTVLHSSVSKDGKLAVSTSAGDNDILIWKIADGAVVQQLQGKGRSVWAVGGLSHSSDRITVPREGDGNGGPLPGGKCPGGAKG